MVLFSLGAALMHVRQPETHRFRARQATAWLESVLRRYAWRLPAHDLREITDYLEEIQDSAVDAHFGAAGTTGGTGSIYGSFSDPDPADRP